MVLKKTPVRNLATSGMGDLLSGGITKKSWITADGALGLTSE